MDEIAFADARTLVKQIQDKEISSRELLDLFLSRIEKFDGDLNAVVCKRVEYARDLAKRADEAVSKGENWGPLHGLPMTVKDSYNVEGLPTTFGIPQFKDNVVTSNAVAIERLESAGAIVFGKTNIPFNLADIQSFNEIYGTTNNPYDLERTPGGSSGGSAAAVAAGFSPVEMGSDIGGSIRAPAHFCGVFGLKPTWNILPLRGHSVLGSLTPRDISVIGPFARNAQDLELMLEIVAGADDLQFPGWNLSLPKADQKELRDFRVAVWSDESIAPVDSEIIDRIGLVAKIASSGGAKVDFEARPSFSVKESHETYEKLLHAAMSAQVPEEEFLGRWEKRQNLDSDDFSDLARLTRNTTLLHREWFTANERRTKLRWEWHEFFKEYDVVLAPVASVCAFPHDQNPKISERLLKVNGEKRPYNDLFFWAGLSCVSYLPSTVLPTGLGNDGLPIGIQVIGAEMQDLKTIRFAQLIDEQLNGFVPPEKYAV